MCKIRTSRRPRPPRNDDLGQQDVGCYGSRYYETPHVDQLARDGVLFSQAYASCHVCSPTRASILTGKYPARLQSPGSAIRHGDYKLIEYFENNTVQLFNLRSDPGEEHDLAQVESEQATQLRTMLHQWRTKVAASMMEANPDYQPE